MTPRGFVAVNASLSHPELIMGNHVYIGDWVNISKSANGREVKLEDRVHLYGEIFIETGSGASISIGAGTHIQPGCHLHAHLSDISIGACVEVAANCGFFSYDHQIELDRLIMDQPLKSDGSIIVGDGAWIGFGVTVLQGVCIGAGAVIGAGSVVNRDIPENGIAAGIPAKVIKYRTPKTV
jgi:acetyltransferase-like isoleucine patch superfamily enzyme